jgi:hypothetical protein
MLRLRGQSFVAGIYVAAPKLAAAKAFTGLQQLLAGATSGCCMLTFH